jgi:S-DNA-T family DNA segregation ATPase FtsK/SpoIIIE
VTPSERPRLEIVRNADDAPDLPLEQRHDELEPRQEREGESAVVEGEIVSDVPERSSRLPSMVVDRITVLRPDASKQLVKVVAWHGVTVAQGWHSWLVRAWDGLTGGVYRRQIRAAEAMGDGEALAMWLNMRRQAAKDRRKWLKDLPQVGLQVAVFTGGGCLGLVVLLIVVSTLVFVTGAGGFFDVFLWVGGVLKWLFTAVGAVPGHRSAGDIAGGAVAGRTPEGDASRMGVQANRWPQHDTCHDHAVCGGHRPA